MPWPSVSSRKGYAGLRKRNPSGSASQHKCVELIHQALQRFERLLRQRIARFDFQGFQETPLCTAIHFLAKIRAAQVVVREMARFVTLCFHGAFEPRNG
jgi:hypothetical protein